jgi:hypothetical protein
MLHPFVPQSAMPHLRTRPPVARWPRIRSTDRSAGGFFALGFFFPVIGLLIAALISPGQSGPPPGMRAIVCPRCNARQNVDPQEPSYECWQSKTVSSLGGYKRPSVGY